MSFLPHPAGDFELAPAGEHVAILIRIIDLGTQVSAFDDGKRTHQLRLVWELPYQHMKDGRPCIVSKTYNWSMHRLSSLRQHLEGWRGVPFTEKDFGPGGFDIRNALGKACMITVEHTEHNGKTFCSVASLGRVQRGQQIPGAYNELAYLWLDAAVFDREAFERLHEKTRETIAKSPEYQLIVDGKPAPAPQAQAAQAFDDDIPF